MKYLDLTGLGNLVDNIKAQYTPASVTLESIMGAYNANVGANITSYINVEKFSELYAAADAKRLIEVSMGIGYTLVSAAWCYVDGGSRYIGISLIDLFGESELQAASFEFSNSGTSVYLAAKTIRTLGA